MSKRLGSLFLTATFDNVVVLSSTAPADFYLGLAPTSVSVNSGAGVIYPKIFVSGLNSFSSNVSLSVTTSLPTGVELAVHGGRTNTEYHEDMMQILAEAERTSRLIDSLLLLARADAGEGGLQHELTEISTSVREALEQGRSLAASARDR